MFGDSRIVIGCPWRGREWMIKPWFEAAVIAAAKTDINFCFAFVLDEDDGVNQIISDYCINNQIPAYYVTHKRYTGPNEGVDHSWNPEKVEYMVGLRNTLLGVVNSIEPDYFLSLDSDILIQQNVIKNLLIATKDYDAVGGKTHLAEKFSMPSYAILTEGNSLHRPDTNGLFRVDVLMAIKMMTRPAYTIHYRFDPRGEDLGWSQACREAGLKLGYDGRIGSKHIWKESHLLSPDPRVGY